MIVSGTQVCTFRSADRLFGVPVLDVKEITTETSYTSIPHAPQVVLGLVNIRGQIILALDLQLLMGMSGAASSEQRCMVIFKPSVGPLFGLVVDEVCEIVSLTPEQLENFPSVDANGLNELRSGLIHCIAKLDKQLIVLLNSRTILPFIEQLT